MSYTVSRQKRWHDEGKLVVEVTHGGLDYTGPDAFSAKYDGEFKTFPGMHKALEVAIEIAKAWKADAPEKDIFVDWGDNGGGIVSLTEGVLVTDKAALAGMLAFAEEHDEKLPKCTECGGLLPDVRFRYTHELCYDGEQFCVERCAEKNYDKQVSFDSRDNENENENEEVSDGQE